MPSPTTAQDADVKITNVNSNDTSNNSPNNTSNNSPNNTSNPSNCKVTLLPEQDHYLKNQLIKLQLQNEFNSLYNDHLQFLDNFGPPFNDNLNEAQINEKFIIDYAYKYPLLRFFFFNFIKNFPFILNIDNKFQFKIEENQNANNSKINNDYVNQNNSIDYNENITKKLDLNQTNNDLFFKYKFKTFYNYFLTKNLSNSVDRLELTKRKKIFLKFFNSLLILFTSSISTKNELNYYMNYKKHENQLIEDTIKNNSINNNTNYDDDQNIDIHMSNRNLLKKLNQLNSVYINNINLNIIGVIINDPEVNTPNKNKSHNNQDSNSSSYLSKFSSYLYPTSKSSRYYQFVISTNFKSYLGNDSDQFIIQNFNVARRYSDFKTLHQSLSKEFPHINFPDLPLKYKKINSSSFNFNLLLNENDQSNDNDLDDIDGIQLLDHILSSNKNFTKKKNKKTDQKNNSTINSNSNSDSDLSASKQPKDKLITLSRPNIFKKNSSSTSEKHVSSNNDDIDDIDDLDDLDDLNNLSKGSKNNISPLSTTSSFEGSANKNEIKKIPRENLRILLKGYLISLIKIPKISNSLILKEFLSRDSIQKFNNIQKKDFLIRKKFELINLKNQFILQKKIFLSNLELKNELNNFKENYLLNNDVDTTHMLFIIFNEIKEKNSIDELSPILKVLIRWFKFQITSVIYNVFFDSTTNSLKNSTLDNKNNININGANTNTNSNIDSASSLQNYELYNQLKKFHSLFPYSIVYQILKFTNPVVIIKKIFDLFLYQPPSLNFRPNFLFSNPNEEKSDNGNNNNNRSKSFLQTLFSIVINDDLSKINEEINKVESKFISREKNYLKILIFFIKINCNEFHESENGSENGTGSKKLTSIKKNILNSYENKKYGDMDLILIILLNKELWKLCELKYNKGDEKIIMNSYQHWKIHQKSLDVEKENQLDEEQDENEENTKKEKASIKRRLSLKKKKRGLSVEFKNSSKSKSETEEYELYSNLKELFKLYTRKKDKEIYEDLWSEPYLISMIKDFFIIFYEPLIKVMKAADIHLALKEFKFFLNDLIIILEYLYENFYLIKPDKIFLILNLLLNKYEGFAFEFIHNIYKNDNEELFNSFINWVDQFFNFLKFYKTNEANSGLRIDLKAFIEKNAEGIDVDRLVKEIDMIIEEKQRLRKVYDVKKEGEAEKQQQKKCGRSLGETERSNRSETVCSAESERHNEEGLKQETMRDGEWYSKPFNELNFGMEDFGFNKDDFHELTNELNELQKISTNDSEDEQLNKFLNTKDYYQILESGPARDSSESSEISKLSRQFERLVHEALEAYGR
ncbi:Lec1p ASCRUDRAFT_68186 [Ascoidea rubescens DSM 1968]|uniref:PX domain-containing protein n=1 Tax=Ascoidea rubescens DSM 1968 TaxID=1344418 RepID=A0A1D2VRG2_9ASCO|nr:hypothetical protein ASCRUDRAFT_68186 [Ascoidea rubescens DSM 1968]ODV64168.1 hypothetical protein ASCRUDRAFT_68186 [Ascoidea rubescens DSM 1968]